MRIVVMDGVFEIEGLGALVANRVSNPKSNSIPVSEVVSALYSEKKEKGVEQLFKNCIKKFPKATEEKRLLQIAEGAFRSYTILKASTDSARANSMKKELEPLIKYNKKLFKSITSENTLQAKKPLEKNNEVTERKIVKEKKLKPKYITIPEAEEWLSKQTLSLAEIANLATDENAIKKLNGQLKKFVKEHADKNNFTTIVGKKNYPQKTLYGTPYDHNRLGKIGEKEILYSDGKKERKDMYEPGFENFYYAGSPITLPERKYLFVQAPLVKHDDKIDTVQDFWDTVVVMKKSPIIVTVHEPKEKIPRYGTAQRAEYWTSERFTTPMKLRGGWELAKISEEEVAVSRHSPNIKIVKRSFIAKHATTKEEHKVVQLHYQGWPDLCGAPDHELLNILHKTVEKELAARGANKEIPITVHCAAGIGRTPNFGISNYLRHEFLLKIAQNKKIEAIKLNVAKTIFEVKKQRPSILEGDDQLQSVLLILRRLYLEHLGTDPTKILLAEQQFETQIFAKAEKILKDDLEQGKQFQTTSSLVTSSNNNTNV